MVATATSTPALRYNTLSASLAIDEAYPLTIAKVSILSSLVLRRASKVSAVSPDCDIKIAKVFLS